mmetsp:Transcript_2814/g.8597  ORF Transcript_2814/g.8597 Transcript_2814/m.8597 type:complete len:1020 (+) Transcript_2814:105-3164(+)|eukprot:CAMPEP_0198725116 /NCGR_PEP_ID=MMETSP1475-20131203/2489_1 /TAXON_ID= ORGANISM="Unidentified sp., Strain CCMP1999" /NCGR_SAMPLE_ID=MMETSP1475 /ASSEMBLY_ACC=CAM_ASM_001111 /LENGTH=1019 /DNA_ID=CAMNT_0044486825 /DNA_START=95 /DNA_END=3154 /DNA_ORIENTATION=+
MSWAGSAGAMYLSSSECSEDDRPILVPLQRTMRDAASSMHAELTNLLTSLERMSSEDRKIVLIDYAQRSRHLVLRLLVLLRWSSKYGEVTVAAEKACSLASEREATFDNASNALWSAALRCRKKGRIFPVVSLSRDVLVAGQPGTIPRSVARMVEPSPELATDAQNKLLHRLKSTTRVAVKSALSIGVRGMHMVSGSSGGGYCVCVGVPNVWQADVIYDRPDANKGVLLVTDIRILVGSKGNFAAEAQTAFSDQNRFLLRKLCEDRIRISLQTLHPKVRAEFVNRARVMLTSLQSVMMDEVCIPFAMDCLRRECVALTRDRLYDISAAPLEKSEPEGSIAITYWPSNYLWGQIKLIGSKGLTLDNNHVNGSPRRERPITAVHQPPFANFLKTNLDALDMSTLSFEAYLRKVMYVRQLVRMTQLRNVIVNSEVAKLREGDVRVVANEKCLSVSLVVILRRPGSGLEFRSSQRTGAMRVRVFGIAKIAVFSGSYDEVKLWQGEKPFAGFSEEAMELISAIRNVSRKMQLEAAATAMCVLDVGATRTLPPGTAWVAASSSADPPACQLVPPFAPLERRWPRRFLTLSDPPVVKSPAFDGTRPKPRLTYASTSDGLVFIQEGVFPDGEYRYSGSAVAAASWAVAREAVERRLRRDSLLRAFSAANVASPANASSSYGQCDESEFDVDTASRTLLRVKCEPLPVQKAELLLRGNYAWQIRLSLLPAIFDSTDAVQGDEETGSRGSSWSVGLSCVDSTLTFTYPSANASSVRSFFRDLTRARTAAALARGVPSSSLYTVIRRSPVRLIVAIGEGVASSSPCTVTVEYVYSKGNAGGFSVTFSPAKATFVQLAPLVEETLDASGGSVGTVLAGLLERACPIAAAAEASVREKGNGRIRFVTALRIRAIFYPSVPGSAPNKSAPAGDRPAHAVDVDARNGGGIAKVIDVGRATAIMTAQSFAQRGGAQRRHKFAPVPMWDELVDELAQRDIAVSICANSIVFLKVEHLENFLANLVRSARGAQRRVP